MNFKHIVALCALTGGVAVGHAQDVKFNVPGQGNQPAAPAPAATAAAPAAAPAAPTFTNDQLVEELGWFYGKKMGLAELGFTKADMAALIKGMSLAVEGKDSPYDLEKIGPQVDAFMQQKQTAYLEKVKQKSLAENEAFFTKLKQNKNVQELPDGLRYEVLKPGTGPYPTANDTVKVNYTGTLLDGTVFDSSVERNEPATFALKDVIPGWTEGIQKINQGGKIRLYVPPQLAYGDEARPGIPPGSTLIFDVDLLQINPPAAPAQQAQQPAAEQTK